jgi:hypothetical protein
MLAPWRTAGSAASGPQSSGHASQILISGGDPKELGSIYHAMVAWACSNPDVLENERAIADLLSRQASPSRSMRRRFVFPSRLSLHGLPLRGPIARSALNIPSVQRWKAASELSGGLTSSSARLFIASLGVPPDARPMRERVLGSASGVACFGGSVLASTGYRERLGPLRAPAPAHASVTEISFGRHECSHSPLGSGTGLLKPPAGPGNGRRGSTACRRSGWRAPSPDPLAPRESRSPEGWRPGYRSRLGTAPRRAL